MIIGKIQPKDVKVYIDGGVPYLDYVGISDTDFGKCQVHFPKLSLTIGSVEVEKNTEYAYDCFKKPVVAFTKFNALVSTDGNWVEIKILEREMSKEQIEKELGYKIKIKE